MKSLNSLLRQYRNDRTGRRTSVEWQVWVLDVWILSQPPLRFEDWFRLYITMSVFNHRFVRGMAITAQSPHELVFAVMALGALRTHTGEFDRADGPISHAYRVELEGLTQLLITKSRQVAKSSPTEHAELWRLLAKTPRALEHFVCMSNWSEGFR